MFDGPLDTLVKRLAALPGLGTRSARRIALHLLTKKDSTLIPLAQALTQAAQTVKTCSACGNLDASDPCRICRDPLREKTSLCVVAGVADLWAIERTKSYPGHYHVLGGVLSAIDGVRPADLKIDSLIERLRTQNIQEVILALSATVDGQSTAHLLMDRLAEAAPGIRITRLAHGVPVGGELDYLDDGTIATAMKSRAAL